MFRLFSATVLFATCLIGSGCASTVKKPNTPADDIPAREAMTMVAPPGERYFIVVFGSQSTPKQAKYTHTWSTAIRMTGCDGPTPTLEEHTISWMPATLKIRSLARTPEKGVNLGLHVTIEEMLKNDERVSVWGPYEIGPGLFHRFLVQKQFMESGQIGYQCIDSIGEAARLGNGCDCIHAITDMDPQFGRNRYPLSYYGEAGSKHVVGEIHKRPIIINPKQDNSCLLTSLGLDKYTLVRKKYSGTVVENTPENVEKALQKIEGCK